MSVAGPLRVGMVGYAFMGGVHSHAWRSAHRFFDLPLTPELTALAGRNASSVQAAADKMGWTSVETDWRRLIERDDIDLIDICTPGDTHAEIAIAALQAGKHVLCEKPLANSVAEAEEMTRAASAAAADGVMAMCGFTYRRTPALALFRQMVRDGKVGTIRQVRAQYLQDWLSDENAPLTWRMDKEKADPRPGRHRGPHHRCVPVRHRPPDHRCVRDHGDLREGTPGRWRSRRARRSWRSRRGRAERSGHGG